MLPDGLGSARYRDFHAALIEDAEAGRWTILDFWDSLLWLGGADWAAWRAFMAALYALPMVPAELEIYQQCTGRVAAPERPAKEAWISAGRRARKSAAMAVLAAYVGAYRDHSKYLAPRDRARIPVLSKTKTDAQVIKRYVDGIFATPALAWLVEDSGAETVRLKTGVDIEIRAAVITAGRGPASPLAILDEIAFFRTDDSAHPDREIVTGITGSFTNVPGAMLIAASSPYARRGLLWERHKEYHGKEGAPVLVWQAPTLVMHKTAQIEEHVAEEYAKDPASAAAEYGAQFREDVQAYVPEHVVDACIEAGVTVREPVPGKQYFAFVDPSGGTSDSFGMGIAHWEPSTTELGRVVLDYVHESQAPFVPSDVVEEACAILKHYGIESVEGDHYAGEWAREPFRRQGVSYFVTDYPKREIYKNFLPYLTSQRVALLDVKRLKAQLLGLDRKTTSAGQDIIDHGPNGKDDVANAVAGACFRAGRLRRGPRAVPLPPPKTTHEILKRAVVAELEEEKRANVAPLNPWRVARK